MDITTLQDEFNALSDQASSMENALLLAECVASRGGSLQEALDVIRVNIHRRRARAKQIYQEIQEAMK